MRDGVRVCGVIGPHGETTMVSKRAGALQRYVVRGDPMTREAAVQLAIGILDSLATDEERDEIGFQW